MDYFLRVDVFHGLDDLIDVACRLLLSIVTIRLRFELFVQLTLRTVLQDQVNLVVIIEESVELDNILVAQVAVDLDLATELVRNSRLK